MIGISSAAVCLALLVVATKADDFGFDLSDSDDLEVEISGQDVNLAALEPPHQPPRKLKGIPDVTAEAGKLLQFTVPEDAFAGYIVRLEVTSPMPSWLTFNPGTRTFSGLPLSTDKADALVSVVAHGSDTSKSSAHAIFRVHVRRQPATVPCSNQPLVLTIYIDKKLNSVKPQQRAASMENLARFMGINTSAFTLGAQRHYIETISSSVILSGPGNAKKRSSKQTSNIDLLVGCGNKLWDKYISLISQLKEQAEDGTLAEVIGLPVISWRVEQETAPLERGRRDTPPGEDNFADYYEDYEEEYEDEDEYSEGITTMLPETTKSSTTPTPATTTTTTTTTTVPTTTTLQTTEVETHPHRHHHGELPKIHGQEIIPEILFTDDDDDLTTSWSTFAVPTTTQRVSTVTENDATTKSDSDYYTIDEEEDDDLIDYDESETEVPFVPHTEAPIIRNTISTSSSSFSSSSSSISSSISSSTTGKTTGGDMQWTEVTSKHPETTVEVTTTEKMTTFMIVPTVIEETTMEEIIPITFSAEPSTIPTIPTTTVRTSSVPITTEEITTTSTTSTTEEPTHTTTILVDTTTEKQINSWSPTIPFIRTTEIIDYGPKNFPPVINQRLKKIRITAGTVLSYFIPEDTFTDSEDGTNIVLKFLDAEQAPVKKNFWIQFNERTREIYGLPLEEHVSKWEFIIEATDKEGSSVQDTLEVTVQQHKGRRAVTHEFTLLMRVEKKHEFPTAVDWQLRTLRGLASLFHNKDLTQIVVRKIDFSTDFVAFTWTNDTLPRSYCPKNELDYLLSVMVANNEGDPSFALSQVLAPELRVKNIDYRGIGQCEEKPDQPVAPPKASPTNFSPIPRNQVDHINATVGELLVFRVPDDTFYDPEDGDARNLKMSLLTMDRQPLPLDHWLQFDVKNQEFFGVPLNLDIGRKEYQLVCEDRGGLTANDGLVVTVNAAPKIRYNVGFSMTLETPYETFINSASIKRKFVEKLRDLFRDRDTSHIRINSITEGSTIVSWHNKSLSIDRCPDKDIKRLRQVLVNDDESYADRVEVIMGPEFPVSAISLTPTGLCQGELTVVHTPSPPVDEQPSADASDDYLITFIVPAVIIAAMLLLAGIVACVLYRRRRTGKMNVEDDERLNNFRSKGIPVIFQDEIDEKPESGTKTPVILKEEKPPLAPPEYSKSATPVQPAAPEETSDAPYQPPPPFASNQDNGRQPRPKPTPTYRKPPPYVPP